MRTLFKRSNLCSNVVNLLALKHFKGPYHLLFYSRAESSTATKL